MNLYRNKLKYLSIHYLPSGLFVVVSWASFLIPPEIVAGRMAMLITLFLVLINIFSGITGYAIQKECYCTQKFQLVVALTSHMPNADGVTAIAVWVIVCIFFVFGALLCYAYLLWRLKPSMLKNKNKKRETKREINKEEDEDEVDAMNKKKAQDDGEVNIVTTDKGAFGGGGGGNSCSIKKYQLTRVDDTCLVAFPLIFILFNVLYWSICLNTAPTKGKFMHFPNRSSGIVPIMQKKLVDALALQFALQMFSTKTFRRECELCIRSYHKLSYCTLTNKSLSRIISLRVRTFHGDKTPLKPRAQYGTKATREK